MTPLDQPQPHPQPQPYPHPQPAGAAPARQPVLTLQGLSRQFGPLKAVDAVDLTILENEFFALLGPSGCGKTTLLRMLAGFERPTAGRILLDGEDIAPVPPERRPLNLMFQSYALFPHMTVRGNIAYGLEAERLPRGQVAERVAQILAVTQLEALADRRPDQLSGGQRQRVALARALVKRPRVLLLDEPLAALDKKLREQMQLELKRLQHEVGITFIIVTHDQEEALVMSDRIAVMRHGRIAQCDRPHAVYEHPSSRFVADFIGKMNFIDGVLAGGILTTADGHRLLTPAPGAPPGTPALPPGAAVLAIRPERVRLAPRGTDAAVPEPARASDESAVPATVRDLAYHGLDVQVHLASPAAAQPLQARLTAAGHDRQPLAPGQPVWLIWRTADARLFAAEP